MHRVLSLTSEPDVPDEAVAALLDSPAKRAAMHRKLHLADHQFLRVLFQNAYEVGGGLWRSNQPSPKQLESWAERGIRTVINLRGVSPASFHVLERDACRRLGLELVTFRVASRGAPPKDMATRARALFEGVRYPALMHCKSGADRAGFMGVLYRHIRMGVAVSEAIEQLSVKYLHIRAGKTGILDAYFDAYIAEGEAQGLTLEDWSQRLYDPARLKAAFQPTAFGSWFVDQVLRRE